MGERIFYNYQAWLKAENKRDTDTAREWWLCPEEEEEKFVKENSWFFGESRYDEDEDY